ncbi:hypothetical protein [Kribbella sp. NPDC000426]|uniref:DUF6928 family protein n=1 Tax=Kribbella sp. NPDC000426 TaxID=3154255 RepID=UPI00332DBED7
MGAKDWMIMYADTDVAGVLRRHPPIDRAACRAFVERLHPGASVIPFEDGTLADQSNPEDGTVYAGVYPGLSVLLTEEAAQDIGDPLPFEQPFWAGERAGEDDADWAEFTKFVVVERPVAVKQQPFDFNPLELGEDALSALFGFVYEGTPPDDAPDLEQVVLAGYRLS